MGLVTGPHARTRTHSQWVVGPGSPPRGRALGCGGAPDPGRPTPEQEAPPPGTLMPPPQHAGERAVGLLTGPHTRTPPHPQPVSSGPRQPARRAGSRGCESARPRTPHTQARGAPPRAPSCHPHSAQRQLARARAVGLVTGPHARTRTHRQWVVGPGSPPRGRALGAGGAPDPGRPTPRQEAPPPDTLMPPPQRAKAARKSARCAVGDGSPRPHLPAPGSSG